MLHSLFPVLELVRPVAISLLLYSDKDRSIRKVGRKLRPVGSEHEKRVFSRYHSVSVKGASCCTLLGECGFKHLAEQPEPPVVELNEGKAIHESPTKRFFNPTDSFIYLSDDPGFFVVD